MEMTNCTVHVHDGACEVWVGTQVPGFAQAGAAKVLGIDPAKVTINNHLLGGAFGRRLEADGVVTAVRIAAHVDGPVKVVWSREEDIRQELYRPLYHDRLKARVENGKITAWQHRVTGFSIMARWLPPAFQDGIDIDAVDGAVKIPYAIGDRLIEYIRHESVIPGAFWRGVGPNSSIFSIESFIDLIARKTGADPVAFRRGMLDKTPRALGVLNLVAQRAEWGTPAPASPFGARRGRGCALMNAFGSYLAAIADVAVSDEGDVRVTRVVVAADVGNVINPDILLAQIQGGVIFGLSAVLHGKITLCRRAGRAGQLQRLPHSADRRDADDRGAYCAEHREFGRHRRTRYRDCATRCRQRRLCGDRRAAYAHADRCNADCEGGLTHAHQANRAHACRDRGGRGGGSRRRGRLDGFPARPVCLRQGSTVDARGL